MMRIMLATALLLAAAPAFAQDRLLVLNKSDNTLVAVDPIAMKVVGSLAVGRGPHEVVASPDGKHAYISNYGDQQPNNSLSVVDLGRMREVARVDLGPLARPHGLAYAAGKVYFTSELSRTVARFDPASQVIDWIGGTGQTATHMVAASSDGRRLYTTSIGSNSVTALVVGNVAPGGITQIPVGAQPEAIDLAPDGRDLWVGHNGDGHISIIDTTTNAVKETFKVGEVPIRLKFTPDGKRVVVSDAKGNAVVVVDVATRKEVKRIPMDGLPLGIQVSPDGRRAYVSRTQVNRVDAIDLDTLEVVGSLVTGRGPDGLAWAK